MFDKINLLVSKNILNNTNYCLFINLQITSNRIIDLALMTCIFLSYQYSKRTLVAYDFSPCIYNKIKLCATASLKYDGKRRIASKIWGHESISAVNQSREWRNFGPVLETILAPWSSGHRCKRAPKEADRRSDDSCSAHSAKPGGMSERRFWSRQASDLHRD